MRRTLRFRLAHITLSTRQQDGRAKVVLSGGGALDRREALRLAVALVRAAAARSSLQM